MRILAKTISLFFLLSFLALFSCGTKKDSVAPNSKVKFYPQGKTYNEILTILDETDKIGMVYFTRGGCKACNRLEQEPFSDEEVSAYINKNFAPFRVHTEQSTGPQLKKKFAVRGYPTVVFITQDGSEVDRIIGFYPQEKYLNLLNNISLGTGDFRSLKKAYEKNPDDIKSAFAYANRLFHDRNENALAKQIYEKLLEVVKNESMRTQIEENLGKIERRLKRRAMIRGEKKVD